MSLRDSILAKNDKKIEPLFIPEWDCTIHVQSLTAGARGKILACLGGQSEEDMHALVVYLCACDENGVRIFSESDIAAIKDRSAKAVQRIVDKVQEMNQSDAPEALAEKN